MYIQYMHIIQGNNRLHSIVCLDMHAKNKYTNLTILIKKADSNLPHTNVFIYVSVCIYLFA